MQGIRFKKRLPKRKFFSATLAVLLVFQFSVYPRQPQGKPPAAGNSNSASNSNQAANSSSAPVPTPVPVSDIIAEAESASEKLEKIQGDIDKSPSVAVIESELPTLKKELDSRVSETNNLLTARPSLETLRMVEQDWKALANDIPGWKADLRGQITVFDNYLKELQEAQSLWQKTLESLEQNQTAERPAGKIPAEILQKINQTIAAIKKTGKQIETARGELLTLQTRVSREEARINEILSSIQKIRQEALTYLFVRDSPAIWNARRTTDSFAGIIREASDSFAAQISVLGEYARRRSEGFVIHALFFVLFAAVLIWARRRLRPMVEKEPELETAFSAFKMPFAGALILTIMLSGWFYPEAPRILSALIGALVLVPVIVYLRRILEKPLFPILNALVVFYFTDQLRHVTETLPLLSRILFLAEIGGAIVFLVWFLRSKKLSSRIEVRHQRIFVFIKKAIPFVLALLAAAFIANLLGFVGLSNIIGNGVLGSSYIALVLYTAVQIIKSLLVFAFRVRPLADLGMVKNYPELIQRKVFKILKWLAVAFWAVLTLNLLSIRETISEYLYGWLTAELVLGSIAVSLSDILIFLATVWLAFAVSRLLRFVLAEDVYPRVDLGGGVSYAISTILHYVLLVSGFVLAIAALGFDLTKFTILAGALGVGIGFGLQNIVNNFVSGLILLFERPVKVNDVVQIGTHQGDLTRIGLRASVLRTLEGAEVIVPNGQLISEEVTNWTFSDQQRRLEINVGVAYGSDPRRVMELLTKTALDNPEVLDEPPPRTLFAAFGESSLDFQLRAWTDSENWVALKSDLTLAVYDVLTENEIEIPFPQRDLHVRSVDEKTLEKIAAENVKRKKSPLSPNRKES